MHDVHDEEFLACSRRSSWAKLLSFVHVPLAGSLSCLLLRATPSWFQCSCPFLLFISSPIIYYTLYSNREDMSERREHKRRESESRTRTQLCVELHSWPYFCNAYWHKSLSLLIGSRVFFWGQRFFIFVNFGGQFFADRYGKKKYVTSQVNFDSSVIK